MKNSEVSIGTLPFSNVRLMFARSTTFGGLIGFLPESSTVMTLGIRRIAGFWKGRDYSAEDRPMDIWMAQPIAGGPWIPVRAEAETIIGTLVVNLRAVSD